MTEHLLRMACVMCSGRSALAPAIKKEEERQVKEEVRQVHFAKVNEVHEQLGTCPLLLHCACTSTILRPAIPREAGLSFLSLGHQARLVTPPVWLVGSFPGGPGSAPCPRDTRSLEPGVRSGWVRILH